MLDLRGVGERLAGEPTRVAALLALIAVVIGASGWLVRVDHLLFDLGQQMRWPEPASDVLIVAIDEDSLHELGRWPWPRQRHAELLHALCANRPAAVGLDIAFSESSDDPQADALLAEAIAACGNVILPLVIEKTHVGGPLLESPPIARLAAVAAGMGRVGVQLDEDGIARAVDLREGIGGAAWPLFAEEVLRVAHRLPAGFQAVVPGASRPGGGHHLVREQHRRLHFIGPPGSVPRLSYAQVLAASQPVEQVAGRIVLIGATAVGLGDSLPTPVSALAQPMPGVEVQANVLLAMRDNRLISPLPRWLALLLAALLAMVPMLWLPRFDPLPGLLASTVWVIALALACALLPGVLRWWLPPAGAVLASLFALPLWSWRRLEAAQRHLDQELMQLRSALPANEQSGILPAKMRRLGFEQRIAWVQAAQRTMHNLEEQRKEALALISHDLRVPLAGAVSQLESEAPVDAQRLLPPLRRAFRMAQSFVWLARAQELDRRQMKEVELTGLLHQVADELHALATRRGLRIERLLPDEPLWWRGDFESLERCAANLLHNALRYAPLATRITLGVDQFGGREVRLWVENDGEPIPGEQAERMFQRFGQGAAEAAADVGGGLGLYYVRTVAKRHGGYAGVDCRAGRVRFWLSLPAGSRSSVERPHVERRRGER